MNTATKHTPNLMGRAINRLVRWLNSDRASCPYCGELMHDISRLNQGEQPRAVLACPNDLCPDKPVYRRVDVETSIPTKRDQTLEAIKGNQAAAYHRLVQMENDITVWVRDRYPETLNGTIPPHKTLINYAEAFYKSDKLTRIIKGGD